MSDATSGRAPSPRAPEDAVDRELPAQASDQTVLFALHPAPRRGVVVVMAQQVKNAVNSVADDFLRGSGAEASRLAEGNVEANEDLAVERLPSFRKSAWRIRWRHLVDGRTRLGSELASGLPQGAGGRRAVVEREHVGRTGVLEVSLVEALDFRVTDEANPEIPSGKFQFTLQEVTDDAAEEAEVRAAAGGRVAEGQGPHGAGFWRPRCSS